MRKTTTALTTLVAAGALTALGLGMAPTARAAVSNTATTAATSGEVRAHHGHGPREGVRQGLDTITTVLDVTLAELRDAREAGTTLAELAEQQGVDVQLLIDALVADAEERIAERVAAGDLTRDEADERLDELEQRITDRVNGVKPAESDRPERGEGGEAGERGERGPGGHGPHGPGAGDRAGDDQSTDDES